MSQESESESIEMSLLLEAIFRKYGYDLREYVPESIERRLRAALVRSGFAHFGELQHRLLYDQEAFVTVLDQLTVQVSEMFRDPAFYLTFRTRVLPVLKTYPEVRIWHAGCSTGEEAYASAILLTEEGLYERAQIYATDLSAAALSRAKNGVYDVERAALFGENYALAGGSGRFSDYGSVAYGRLAMSDALKRNIVFFQHSLGQDYAIGTMHVVFCRNVLLYFERDLRKRVLRMFSDCLRPGGFLCLGASESAPDSDLGMFVDFAPAERIFRRKPGA